MKPSLNIAENQWHYNFLIMPVKHLLNLTIIQELDDLLIDVEQ